ncbi:MAG: galactose oxidase [Robiginitomaculum sp.]|nr:MAG: galactose oxidase [Robiginitomaculum sp.]
MKLQFSLLLICLGLVACGANLAHEENQLFLPIPVSNNAVTLVGDTALSFSGLLSGKSWSDVTDRAFACDLAAQTCREIAGLPDGIGRLASVAVTVQGTPYIFGGYTVDKDGNEASTPDVWRFDLANESYHSMAPMPVPVDDGVALVYEDRYVFLVSGWHNTDNVDLVQVLDVQGNQWFTATAFAGDPVFGHAAAIAGNVMLVCDGVKVVPPVDAQARRTFEGSPACWRGEIDVGDLTQINWRQVGSFAPAHYRMAAAAHGGKIWLAGGTDNPYNYNGLGYDGVPSEASAHVWNYDVAKDQFAIATDKPMASMDHRRMLVWNDKFVILGGMGDDQTVTDKVQMFPVPAASK